MLRLSHLKASLWSSFPSRSAVELFFNELVPVWLMCACAQGLTCMPSKNCRLIKLFHWSTGGAYTKDRLQCTNKSQIQVKDFLNIINTGQKCNSNFMHNVGHWHSNVSFQEAKRKTRIKNSTELLLWYCYGEMGNPHTVTQTSCNEELCLLKQWPGIFEVRSSGEPGEVTSTLQERA